MKLSPGTKLGPYEVIAAIGEGGMGEVYRARDTRLGREVAIKISSEHFSERFEREARAIAALNHPNICQLFDVGPNYLVMELIEGRTLAEKMAAGPIPVEEAIAIARQIADALEEAHSKGIIHRDLKPGNVKLKPSGPSSNMVKVLDFGLAKVGPAVASGSDSPSDPDKSPTVSMVAATEAGVILGTAGYMSPEQARGRQVDKRADIWAFGVVLFEMLTGKRLFKGEDPSETLASVIKEEPDYNRVPAPFRPVLQMCLRKDPSKRLHDITAARLMLEQLEETSSDSGPAVPASRDNNHKMSWAAAAVVVVAIAAGAAWSALRPKPEQPMLQMEITPPDGVRFGTGLTPFALSPDGRKLVFVGAGRDGKRMLWLRPIDAGAATVLAGTENAEIPFWSPDSRWVGFSSNNRLQKLDATGGGQPQVICETDGLAGGTWNSDGVIVFDQVGKPLQRVSAEGGNSTPILTLDASRHEVAQNAPYFLPDGRHLVYLSGGRNGSNVMLATLDGKLNRLLIEGYAVATYAPNPRGGGWILHIAGGQLVGRPFDLDKLEFTGPPAAIADGVGIGRWWYASATGLLAYRHNYGTQFQLAWFGRDGRPQGTVGDPGLLAAPRISPDQETVAFQRTDDQNTDIWTFDLTRNTSARFTFEPGPEASPAWSSDSKSILYGSGSPADPSARARSGSPSTTSIIERSTNGVGQGTVIVSPGGNIVIPTAVSHDGRWLVFVEGNTSVIVIRSREDANKSIRIPDRGMDRDASISPDGRWLLYSAVPANRREVLVQSVPKEAGGSAAPGKWQISTAGGGQPAWRADGKEIFFVAPDGTMMAVPVESGETSFRPGAPKPLFQTRLEFDPGFELNAVHRQYDVTSDGQRFLLNQHVPEATDAPIMVVVNWPKLLEKH